MTKRDECAALLRNIHQVMKAEDVLHQASLWCDLVPVPREISSECGMAVVFACTDRSRVNEVLRTSELEVLAIYRKDGATFERVFDSRCGAEERGR